jgi:hypothetical protein
MVRVYPSTVVKAARKALTPLGFATFNDDYVAKPLSSDATAFVHVSAARAYDGHADEFRLQASFGLRIASLHQMFASLAGWGDSPDFIGISYSPLVGGSRVAQMTWVVSANDIAGELNSLVEAVRGQVLPEMQRLSTAEAVCHRLLQADNDELSWQSHWWVPVAHLTLGQPSEALRMARAELVSAQSQSASNDSYLSRYSSYVHALQSRLAGG